MSQPQRAGVRERQRPLRERYQQTPAAAMITDRGRTVGGTQTDPFHGVVVPGSRDGARCKVIGGTPAGKSGIVRDINTSKSGHVTLTVVPPDGERFKTLARNVAIEPGGA